jgi:hypothetical protein
MIGVVYAPKATPDPTPKEEEREERETSDRPPRSSGGERKMNVVKGGQMFVRKEQNIGSQVGWGTWIWSNVVGGVSSAVSSGKREEQGVVAGSTQSNVVVRALKGLSETVFGF